MGLKDEAKPFHINNSHNIQLKSITLSQIVTQTIFIKYLTSSDQKLKQSLGDSGHNQLNRRNREYKNRQPVTPIFEKEKQKEEHSQQL